MIEFAVLSWVALFALIFFASYAGLALASFMPWSENAIRQHFNIATGLALAPFLAGIATIVVLLLLPGATLQFHLLGVYLLLGMGSLLYLIRRRSSRTKIKSQHDYQYGEWILKIILFLWVFLLLTNAIFFPLVQNDALEYATVGRELFISRSLDIYPLISPETNASGFFGPWTHPPLYVSLIYLFLLLQGHADEPGLIRLISPWFLLTSTYLVIVLGRVNSTTLGWLAGIIFLSTPLLFLGADSALIDALPVSGMALLMIVLTGSKQQPRSHSIALGIVLGLALWTHSQAILFIPIVATAIFALKGAKNWRKASICTLITIAIGLVVGGAPYVRNFFLFGSLISDTPLVFAMPELDWTGYFSYARGLDHSVAVIQYGILKGWFSFEAFGGLFWLWTGGCALFFFRERSAHFVQIVLRGLEKEVAQSSLGQWLSFLLVIIYLIGVIISITMGIDLMIRNERYMLIIAPILTLGGAYLVEALLLTMQSRMQSANSKGILKDTVFCGYLFLVILLLVQLITVAWYYRWKSFQLDTKVAQSIAQKMLDISPDLSRFDKLLGRMPSIKVAMEISKIIPEDSLVLSMRPADMYYAKHKMVSYLDPRLIPFYREKDPAVAVEILKALNIRHVLMTDYSLPTSYHSSLMSILSDPRKSRLVYGSGMTQLYELSDDRQFVGNTLDVTPGKFLWTRTEQLRIGGRKAFGEFGLRASVFDGGVSLSTFPFFHRDYSVALTSGLDGELSGNFYAQYIKVDPGEYVIRVKLTGQGYVVLWIQQFDSNGIQITDSTTDRDRQLRFGDLVLSKKNPSIDFARRIKIEPKTHKIRLEVEHVGRSYVKIESLTLEQLIGDK